MRWCGHVTRETRVVAWQRGSFREMLRCCARKGLEGLYYGLSSELFGNAPKRKWDMTRLQSPKGAGVKLRGMVEWKFASAYERLCLNQMTLFCHGNHMFFFFGHRPIDLSCLAETLQARFFIPVCMELKTSIFQFLLKWLYIHWLEKHNPVLNLRSGTFHCW